MRPQNVISIFSAVAINSIAAQDTGRLGDAAVINNNPVGASYIATMPNDAFFKSAYPQGGNIRGTVQAVSSPDGQGVVFQVELSNLPKEGGPFLYHLHDQPVPADGNCSGTLAHLDPYERGEATPCDASRPQTCQVGDLGGKHGEITSDPYNATYTDLYASTLQGIGAFFGNRSIVIHMANVTRITCANFTVVDQGLSSGGSSTSRPSSSTVLATARPTGTTPTTTGGAGGTNTTATARPTFATAAAPTNIPATMLGIGAAMLVLAL